MTGRAPVWQAALEEGFLTGRIFRLARLLALSALLTGNRLPPTQRGEERVAQTVEHVTFNHGVLGSIPSALTNEIKLLA